MSARLDALLPGPRRTLFLRACLLDGDSARAAWREWLAGADDPVAAFADPRQACRRLAPLLAGVATARFGGQLGAAVAASILREELRWQTLASDAAQILDALWAAGVDCVVSGGVSAAVTVYEKPWQRHCHDIDLVVGAALERAAATVLKAGLRREQTTGSYAHSSGTLLALHATALRSPAHVLPVDDLRRRARAVPVGSSPAVVAAPEHLLVHACEGAFAHGRPWSPLVWAADAAIIARSLDAGGWADVVEAAVSSGTATPVAVSLGFLRGRVGVELPTAPLAELRERAAYEGPAAERACVALDPAVLADVSIGAPGSAQPRPHLAGGTGVNLDRWPPVEEQARVLLAGKVVSIAASTRSLGGLVARPFSHLPSATGPAALRIEATDGGENRGAGPDRVDVARDGAIVTHVRPTGVAKLDRQDGVLRAWWPGADAVPVEDRAKPFLLALAVWLADCGLTVAHAGCVARDDRGSAVRGPGGIGKVDSGPRLHGAGLCVPRR